MNDIVGTWVGTLYGTNHGNLFMEIEGTNEALSGTIRVNEAGTGVYCYTFSGHANDRIELSLVPDFAPPGLELKGGKATAILQPDGAITGRWETELGTAGTLQVYRQRALVSSSSASMPGHAVPEQAFYHSRAVGAVRLYRSDLARLIDSIQNDFIQARAVVTYRDRGADVVKYADSFLEETGIPEELRAIRISIQEPEPSGITKLVGVDLVEGVGSQVRTSGSNESWVLGKASKLHSLLLSRENRLVSLYRRHGLTVNIIIFFVMLVAVPEIEGWGGRAAFVGTVYAMLMMLAQVHRRLVPNTLLFLSEKRPSLWSRSWPSVLSWLLAVTSSLVAMLVFWLVTRGES